MSVSYHLVPVHKETGAFQSLYELTDKRMNNDYSKLANVTFEFQQQVLDFFEKEKTDYDFLFACLEQEVSEKTLVPSVLKNSLEEMLQILKTKTGFPIPAFYYFNYEDTRHFNFLYVTLLGSELNKIVVDKIYHASEAYAINTSFDMLNGYYRSGEEIKQWSSKEISIKDEAGNRSKGALDLSAFPSTIQIIKTERDYGFGKEIKKVDLILKSPFEHYEADLNSLIDLCQLCIEHDLGIKTYVDH